MVARTVWLAVALVLFTVVPSPAQQPTTVQLPSHSTFGVDTSVSVPDRGSMSLGGSGRSSSGSTAFGPSRSYGRQSSASRASVHTRVYDLDAMDRQLLDQAQKSYGKSSVSPSRKTPADASSAATGPAGSVAEARRQHAAETASQEREALKYFAQAERSAASGKPKVARVLYQMAERRASGELKAKIRSRLAELKPAAPPDKVGSR